MIHEDNRDGLFIPHVDAKANIYCPKCNSSNISLYLYKTYPYEYFQCNECDHEWKPEYYASCLALNGCGEIINTGPLTELPKISIDQKKFKPLKCPHCGSTEAILHFVYNPDTNLWTTLFKCGECYSCHDMMECKSEDDEIDGL